jgi:hypothetical protein
VHVRPVLREVVREASRSLACLDAERLEELVISCQALNRDLDAADEERRKGLAQEAEESAREMAIFARVLEATRANMGVMYRLRELRAGRPRFGYEPEIRPSREGGGDGNH